MQPQDFSHANFNDTLYLWAANPWDLQVASPLALYHTEQQPQTSTANAAVTVAAVPCSPSIKDQ